jgi:hypothetical protein
MVRNWLFLRQREFGWDHATLSKYLSIVGGVLLAIAAWVFLLVALFGKRDYSIPIAVQDREERFGATLDTAIQERRSPLA